MLPEEIQHLLTERYPVFRSLPDAVRSAVFAQAQFQKVPSGTVLFTEQRACQAFPMVLEGTVKVVKSAPNGRELQLYRVDPGESCVLTSSCLLGQAPYSARGIADGEVSLVTLPQPAFRRLVEEHEPFRRHLFSLFSERLTDLMQLVEEVAFRKLDERLAGLLVSRGKVLRTTHQGLADELGSVREMITRLLRSFADQGLVRLSREQIEVLDEPALRQIAAGH